MKAKSSLRSFLALSCSALLLVSHAHAQAYYYWDTNGTAAGLGDTAGIWGTSAFSGLINAPNGRGLVGGTLATNNVETTSAHWMNFGTINLSLGGTASTIGIVNTGVTINRIMFGFGQTNAVTLTGGGGAITLAGTTPTIFVNSAPVATIGAVLGGTAGMTKAGPSTLTLTGANTYTGITSIVGGGILNVGDGVAGNLNQAAPTALTFNSGGGTFNVAQAGNGSQDMAALTFTAGDGTVRSTAASVSAKQTVTFASLATRSPGATGNFSLATNPTAADNKIVLTSATNAPLNTTSNDAGLYFGGTEYARYDSLNGYFRAASYGTDTNAVAPLSGATLGAVTAVTDVKLNGNITAQTTGAVNTIHLNGNTLTLLDNDQALDVNGILSNGGSIAAAGALQGITAGGEIVFNTTGGNLAVAAKIQDSRLTKSGPGTLTLSGANTYGGITNINAGTLALSGGSAIADTGAIVLANAQGTTLRLDSSETIGNLTGGGFSGGVVDVQGNTLTFGDSGNRTFGGTFTGTAGGAITKQGSGILSLSNINTFAGTINLDAGTLSFTLGNSGTTTAQSISSGGAINLAGGTTMRFIPGIQVDLGQHNGNNDSQLVAPHAWTIGNAINITSETATFRFAQNGNRWNFTGDVSGGTSGSQTLGILQGSPAGSANAAGGDSQSIRFSGVIQDGAGGTLGVSADFTNSSSVNQTAFINLSGLNTFTGPITVSNTRGLNNGAFFVIGGDRINNGTGITPGTGYLGGGNYTNTISLATGTILDYASSANQTLAGVISGTGAILKEGAGTLTLAGESTINFVLPGMGAPVVTTGVVIRAGTLSVGSLNSVVGGTATSNLGAPTTAAAGTIAIGSAAIAGTLTYTGSGETTDRVINLAGTTGGAILNQSGTSGLLKFTSNLTATVNGAKTLTLTGSTAGSGEIEGAIVNSTGTTAVTKTGTNTWTLSGTNTYTGTTTVSEGTLRINGDSSLATGNVTVAANATLGGSGTLGGEVIVSNDGKLTFNLSTAPGSHNKMDLVTGKAIQFLGASSLVITASGTPTTGTFTLITAPDGFIGTLPGVTLPAGWTADPLTVVNTTDLVINITSVGAGPGDPYTTWAGPGVPFDGDANGDGVTNGLAFLLGATGPGVNALNKLPTASKTAGGLGLTFQMLDAAARGTAMLKLEYSTTLATGSWTTVAVPDSSSTVDDVAFTIIGTGPLNVTATIPASKAVGGKLFSRLRAEKP